MELQDRPGGKIDGKDFPEHIIGQNYSGNRIEWCRGKAVKFENCNFHSTMFRLCYFHKALFVNCDFTGAIFIDSNFRGAVFDGCRFYYTQFRSTQIDLDQIKNNLPEWENCRRELLRNLRKNAESIGEIDDVRAAFYLEQESAHEHWRNACKRPSQYFKSHYKGFSGQFYAWKNRIALYLQKYYWGYGESPSRLLISTVVIVFIFAFSLQPVNDVELSMNYFEKSIALLSYIAGGKSFIIENRSNFFIIVLNLFKFVSIGLFATMIVRRFARR